MSASRSVVLVAAVVSWVAAPAQETTGSGAAGAGPQDVEAGNVRQGAAPGGALDAARKAVEAHRARLEGEIAELAAIVEAQTALVEYVESGGAGEDEGLDPRLCRESALRALCPELLETFGESGG